MRYRRLPGRKQIRYAYYVARNAGTAAVNSFVGEEAAEMRRLQRDGRLVVGPWFYGHPRIFADRHGRERLIIGGYCGLAGMWILGGNHGPNRVSTYPHRINFGLDGDYDAWPIPTGDTVVGADVWACENCLVLAGIKIGHGAIIAAGAVVTKDVPPYAIVAGNPARVIRYRFTEEQIDALLEIRWWDWPEERVREAVPWLESEDVDAFIAYAQGEVAVAGVTAAG